MAKKKKANAIVHSVNLGGGVKLYYEKTDATVYRGEEATIIRDIMTIVWNITKLYMARRWADIKDEIVRNEPQWPPHNLFCECNKCIKKHAGYAKGLKG